MQVIDFEVFKHDWLCVIYDLVKKQVTKIHNDTETLRKYYEENKSDIFIGYNIREYDQYIFKGILLGFNPKEINDFIILGRNKGFQFSRMFNTVPLNIFDVMPNPPISLKTLEGFMGSDIRESSVPWDIDRPLTKEELADTFFYCEHDVSETAAVLSQRVEELTSHIELVKMFNLPKRELSRTKAQLSATVLGARRQNSRYDDFDFSIPDNLKIEKYSHIVDWFRDSKTKKTGEDYESFAREFYKRKLNTQVANVPHVFAWGGIHGALLNYHGKGYFVNIDVASYYPSMMIEYGYESRNLSDPAKYKEIYTTRLEHKKNKDPRANPLKIVLNSTYGAMKDKNSALYDPLQANNVCVTGQLLLLDLLEHLEPYFDIIQSNTDGVLVKLRAETEEQANVEYERLDDVCHEWEKRTRMNLEFEEFSEVYQADVNNYVIIAKDGSYKSKGFAVKKLSELDNDLPIVNKALINYMVHGIPIEETVNGCNDLIEFQKIVKVSSKYQFAMHGSKRVEGKTFRVFASNAFGENRIYKVKQEGANPEKFANTPDNCFIDNEEVRGKKVPNILDKQWYIALAKDRLKRFVEVEKV